MSPSHKRPRQLQQQRYRDSKSNGADCPAAEFKRATQERLQDPRKAAHPRACEAGAETPGPRASEGPASAGGDPPQPPEPPSPARLQPRAQLCTPSGWRESTEGEGPGGERWERRAAASIPGRETSNTERGLNPDPARPRGGHVPDVTVPLLVPPLTPFAVKMN